MTGVESGTIVGVLNTGARLLSLVLGPCLIQISSTLELDFVF